MLKKLNPITFIKQTILELKRVDWLSKSELAKYSTIVLVSLIVGTIFIMIVDQIFVLIRNLLIL